MMTISRLFLAAVLPVLISSTALHAAEGLPKAEPSPADSASKAPATAADKQEAPASASAKSPNEAPKTPSMKDYCREHTC